jgi:hypothetical protein
MSRPTLIDVPAEELELGMLVHFETIGPRAVMDAPRRIRSGVVQVLLGWPGKPHIRWDLAARFPVAVIDQARI